MHYQRMARSSAQLTKSNTKPSLPSAMRMKGCPGFLLCDVSSLGFGQMLLLLQVGTL
jgi:hypothetical protein